MDTTSLAIETLGVYPEATINDDGTETARTQFGDGWNEAIATIYHNILLLQTFIQGLLVSQYEMLDTLINTGVINLEIAQNRVIMQVNVGDSFLFNSEEVQEVQLEDLHDIFDSYEKYGTSGPTAWVSVRKRKGQNPLNPLLTSEFRDAKKDLESA